MCCCLDMDTEHKSGANDYYYVDLYWGVRRGLKLLPGVFVHAGPRRPSWINVRS